MRIDSMRVYSIASVSGLLCILFFGACSRQKEEEHLQVSEELEAAEDEALAKLSPLSIERLRRRVYPALEIELKNTSTAEEGLESWEFSYDSDGHTIYGLLEKPIGNPPPNGWPVIILAHGYIPPDIYSTLKNYRSVTQHYAKGGFLVLKPDYRGHDRSEGNSNGGPIGPIEYSIDVLNLIEQVGSIPDADTDNVFLYGHSMGGEIGLRVLTISKALRGATLWASVTEPFPENKMYFIRKRSSSEAEEYQKSIEAMFTPDEYASLSPNGYYDSIDIPILIHHGTQDESVPFEWSVSFREELDKAGVEYTFYQYPGEDHNISESFFTVMDKDMEFFRGLMNDSAESGSDT